MISVIFARDDDIRHRHWCRDRGDDHDRTCRRNGCARSWRAATQDRKGADSRERHAAGDRKCDVNRQSQRHRPAAPTTVIRRPKAMPQPRTIESTVFRFRCQGGQVSFAPNLDRGPHPCHRQCDTGDDVEDHVGEIEEGRARGGREIDRVQPVNQ